MANSNSSLHGRILVTEDARDTRQLLRVFLEQAGLTVDFAYDGIMACQMTEAAMAAGKPPHLILMDLHMPKLDGLGAMRQLRRSGWNGPIIALTARTLAQDRDACLHAGFSDFVSKPIDWAHLLQVIGRHLGRGKTPSARSEGMLDDPRISPADRAKILLGFIARMQNSAATIERAVSETNLWAIMESAHALHGSAGLLGFSQIAEAAKAVEEQARSHANSQSVLTSALKLAQLCRQTAAQYPQCS